MTPGFSATAQEQKVYKRAPIIEAVIDVQVTFAEVPSPDRLTECADSIQETFPTRLPISVVQMGMEARDGKLEQKEISQQQTGWRLSNAKNDRVLQLQRAGFTYSHLAPYTQWDVFQGEAKLLWDEYVSALNPATITRIATRYINRIEIPAVAIQLEDYFNVTPRAPDSIGPLSTFLVQIQVPYQSPERTQAVITVAPGPAMGSPPTPGILLDIDVSCSAPDVQPRSLKLWEYLGQMRRIKNKIFEDCITDKTRELIS